VALLADRRSLVVVVCGRIILLLAGRISKVTLSSPYKSAKQGARHG